jgi:predicted transcriptional regulator of viral defense system
MGREDYLSLGGKAISSSLAEEILFIGRHPQFLGFWKSLGESDMQVLIWLVENQKKEITVVEAEEVLGLTKGSASACLRRLCEQDILSDNGRSQYRLNGDKDDYIRTRYKVSAWVIACSK